MADLLSTGATFLNTTRRAYLSQTVTYTRGANSVTIPATLGKKLLQLWDMDGVAQLQWTDLELLITAADLVLNGVAVQPAEGDRISLTLNGTTKVFEPYRMDNEPWWRFTDGYELQYRLHLQCVSGGP